MHINLKKAGMKNLKNYLFALTLILGATLLSSCLKDDDNTPEPVSALTVVNAYSGSAAIDFYMNNQPVVSLDYTSKAGYFNIYSGTRRLTATKKGTNTVLSDKNHVFAEGKYFSLFIANQTDANADSAVFVVTQDSLVQTVAGKASIRFVNLTPGTRNIDVFVKGSATPLFSNRAFKSATDFVTIDPSANLILEIREAGSATVKYEIPSTAITAANIYTVYSAGSWEGSGATALTAKILNN